MSLANAMAGVVAAACVGLCGCAESFREPETETTPNPSSPSAQPPAAQPAAAQPSVAQADTAPGPAPQPMAQAEPPSMPTPRFGVPDHPFPPKGAEKTPFGGHIGMTMGQFRRVFPAATFPELTLDDGPDTQVSIPVRVHGLDGSWTYTFQAGKLEWVLYDHYIDEITAPNFDKCLAAIDGIIADYTSLYGPPTVMNLGNRVFIDPFNQNHYGYEVMEATWKVPGMKFQAEFDFMGGKAQYHFLVKMEFQPEDYPYF